MWERCAPSSSPSPTLPKSGTSLERLNGALRMANAATWEFDLRTGEAYFSDNIADFFGERPSGTAADFLRRIYKEDHGLVGDAMTAHLEGGPPLDIDHRIWVAGAGPIWVRALATAIRDRNGAVTRWSGFFMDVSSRKRQEAELATALSAAEAANRAKTEFVANTSHEIRTPLNGVIGLAGALAATPLSREQREIVRLIEQSGEQLLGLLNDVLDLSKVEVRTPRSPAGSAARAWGSPSARPSWRSEAGASGPNRSRAKAAPSTSR